MTDCGQLDPGLGVMKPFALILVVSISVACSTPTETPVNPTPSPTNPGTEPGEPPGGEELIVDWTDSSRAVRFDDGWGIARLRGRRSPALCG